MANKVVLLLDGKVVLRGTETEAWQYIHRNTCYSVDYALKYGGYAIKPECGYYGCDNPAEPGEVCHGCADTREEHRDEDSEYREG